jgi:hypothetical protein
MLGIGEEGGISQMWRWKEKHGDRCCSLILSAPKGHVLVAWFPACVTIGRYWNL